MEAAAESCAQDRSRSKAEAGEERQVGGQLPVGLGGGGQGRAQLGLSTPSGLPAWPVQEEKLPVDYKGLHRILLTIYLLIPKT